ncbi:MAG: glutamine synthetase family protein [Pseudomonadota bacterium]
MSETNEYIRDWIESHDISEVECLIPDLTGNARGKIVPASKYCKEYGMRIPEVIFTQTVTGEWTEGSDVVNPVEIDMFGVPDKSTIRKLPWIEEPTAQIIHDCNYRSGEPVDLAPRSLLKHVLSLYQAEGLVPIIAPELEFYLTKPNPDPDLPLEQPMGRSGRRYNARQAYSIDSVNQFDPVLDDVYDFCEVLELDVDTLIHESGPAQMEINFLHGEVLQLADQVFMFKRAVREAAMRHDICATFMAKPLAGEPGSSMHIHQSMLSLDDKRNVFDDHGKPSDIFLQFIAGQQTYLPPAMAFLAPNVNSYRRFARFESAPINTEWGYDNRTVGLRVPFSDSANMRVENRLAGADANPYLAFAASLACGYLGIKQGLSPRDPLEKSAYDLQQNLPRTLEEALQSLSDCKPLVDLLGERFIAVYTDVKQLEYETFFQVISSWEREHLLSNV